MEKLNEIITRVSSQISQNQSQKEIRNTLTYMSRCKRCGEEFNYYETDYQTQYCLKCLTYIRRAETLKARGLPPRAIGVEFNKIERLSLQKKAIESLENWNTIKNRTIFLTGGTGTGKTTLLYALGNKFIKTGKKFYYIYSPEFLRRIRAGYENGRADYEIELIGSSKILLWDDFGVERVTDWVLETLESIIDHRYTHLLSTVYTSNLSLQELEDRLSPRIISRIIEDAKIIKIEGKDLRLEKCFR